MKVTPYQFERVRRWRRVYLGSPDGKKCLAEHLLATGLFNEPGDMEAMLEADPHSIANVLLGIRLLHDMGVWTYENFPLLIDAMAALPLPEIEE